MKTFLSTIAMLFMFCLTMAGQNQQADQSGAKNWFYPETLNNSIEPRGIGAD